MNQVRPVENTAAIMLTVGGIQFGKSISASDLENNRLGYNCNKFETLAFEAMMFAFVNHTFSILLVLPEVPPVFLKPYLK